jgi:nucleotide-binding universal stress UspA family protein
MNMPYKKILVAYDGSKASEYAIKQAIMLAQDNESTQLEVVFVYNLPTIILGEAMFTLPSGYETESLAYSKAVVEQAKLLLQDIPHHTVTTHYGNPAKVILEQAEETHCDLIVIGSKGHSGIMEFMLGSVSHNVVLHAKVPVLVVK